jgi:2,3-bisphosphoglycerate-dependent phosphoglycerate mutase
MPPRGIVVPIDETRQRTMPTLILLRHGQSTWNREHRFTGWSDAPLTRRGEREAEHAGRLIREAGHCVDSLFTSELARAVESTRLIQKILGAERAPVRRNWRLNERSYGALEGLTPLRAILRYGPLAVVRSHGRFRHTPPPLATSDPRFPGRQARYRHLTPEQLPRSESMQQTLDRLLPAWRDEIRPELALGRCVLVVSHKNALRVLIKHLDGLSEREAERLSIVTGHPLVYEFDDDLKLMRQCRLDGNGQNV